MVFSGFSFLFAFLPCVLLIYYLIPGIRAKNLVLCVSSLLFYSWGEPVYAVLMVLSILFNYATCLVMDKAKHRRGILFFAVVVNLLALGYFKYAGFIVENLNLIPGLQISMKSVALPVGISFYTFQILSYDIDVYRRKVDVQHNVLLLATYISMFPQLIAGPIVSYDTIAAELSDRRISLQNVIHGGNRFILGLGKKVIIANQLAEMAASMELTSAELPAASLWLGGLIFGLQIYFDFSGYSDMAVGLGEMLGFHFKENFCYPYMAASITEFWRRWHISLSTWFRDYVYIPLGGNRVSRCRQIMNLLVVWGLTGLWHGANWNFLLWGLYYGLLLIMEKFVLRKLLPHIPALLRRFLTLILILLGWMIFNTESVSLLINQFATMFVFDNIGLSAYVTAHADLLKNLWILPVALVGCFPIARRLSTLRDKHRSLCVLQVLWTVLIWYLSITFLLGETYNPFIYFRF